MASNAVSCPSLLGLLRVLYRLNMVLMIFLECCLASDALRAPLDDQLAFFAGGPFSLRPAKTRVVR